MTDIKHLIEPERFGLWIAVTFVMALLALVLGLFGIIHSSNLMYVTQTEALLLNKKIENISPKPIAPEPSAAQESK